MIKDMRAEVAALFARAVEAADPARCVERALADHPFPRPDAGGRLILIAIGKAAPAMMEAALEAADGPTEALVVTHKGNGRNIAGAQVMEAAHPVPDEDGLRAGTAVADLARGAGAADRIVALISGGGSALVPAPAPPLALDDKIAVNEALLASGLEINQMNLVRQTLSTLKGGGLARLAAPASVTAYILSDVIGDDLRAIASGPTVSPLGTPTEARALLEGAGVWDGLPDAVRDYLETAPDPGPAPTVANHLIGSNVQSLKAVCAGAGDKTCRIVSDHLTGDVADAVENIFTTASKPVSEPEILVFGGETTVRLTGTGKGGRNQDLALRVAIAGPERIPGQWVFLSGGTDGRDGPTDAAGGIVDAGSCTRMVAVGIDPAARLANNDSNAALAASGDLLMTGPTGTNVADVQILLRMP